MVRLRRLDVISCAKISGLLHMALGVLVALFLVVIGLIGAAASPGKERLGMIGVLVMAALSPFIYGAIGFVGGAITALLYNWVASAVGGIQMELEAVPAEFSVPAPPPAPYASA